jgi:hypothetical protein
MRIFLDSKANAKNARPDKAKAGWASGGFAVALGPLSCALACLEAFPTFVANLYTPIRFGAGARKLLAAHLLEVGERAGSKLQPSRTKFASRATRWHWPGWSCERCGESPWRTACWRWAPASLRCREGLSARSGRTLTIKTGASESKWPNPSEGQCRSNRSAFITLVQTATKSLMNFSWLSSCAYTSA